MSTESESSRLRSTVRELLQQGDLRRADVLVDEALTTAPRNADALYLRGVIANRRRDHGAAVEALLQSIGVRPEAALSWLALGNAYARTDQLQDAAAAYREVLEREARWADAHFNLGLVQKRLGDRPAAADALHAAWCCDPMMFDAAKQCVATIADCVRLGEVPAANAPVIADPVSHSFTIVLCSIDDVKHERTLALYRRLFANLPHEVISIRNPRSLAAAYNQAAAASEADIVVFSHDDIDVLAPDFAARLSRQMTEFDVVGVVGSLRMDGPAVGWSGHPNLRGWITHRSTDDRAWRVDVLDPRPVSGDVMILDGVLLAARREVVTAVPFDAVTFDGFHLYDLDWSYRAARGGFRAGVAGALLVVHESRGKYGAAWQRYADRFSVKHDAGRTPARPSSFFGATLDNPDQVRAFYALLADLSARHAGYLPG